MASPFRAPQPGADIDRGRTAALLGLVVLAVLQAADLIATGALLHHHRAELNPLGRALIGTGGAVVAKFGILAALMALVVLQRVTRLGLICGVWAVAGIYVAVVAMNFYTLHLVAHVH
jgi:hypothetical protein